MKKIPLYMSLWRMHGGAPGLALFSFDQETGEIMLEKQLNDSISFGCSFFDQEKDLLYLCNEDDLESEAGYHTGRIYGYRISRTDGSLTEVFHRDTLCPFPDYVNFSPDRRYMVVPHHSFPVSVTTIQQEESGRYVPVNTYMDSAIDLFRMKDDGTPDELVHVVKHSSHKRMTDFQGKMTIPHPHCAVFSPDGKLIAVCDKGDGCLYLYRLNEQTQQLECLSRTMTDAPLSEPRYCAFHPTKPWLFVNHEHTAHGRMIVSAFQYDANGQVTLISKIDCLPAEYTDHAEGQGFCLSKDGRYLYNLLQGYGAVAVLKVDQNTGAVQLEQLMPVRGERPRCCALSPDGRFLITGNLSGEIAAFAVSQSGLLSPTPYQAFLQGSAYIQFVYP